jgi:hypothetical protein
MNVYWDLYTGIKKVIDGEETAGNVLIISYDFGAHLFDEAKWNYLWLEIQSKFEGYTEEQVKAAIQSVDSHIVEFTTAPVDTTVHGECQDVQYLFKAGLQKLTE